MCKVIEASLSGAIAMHHDRASAMRRQAQRGSACEYNEQCTLPNRSSNSIGSAYGGVEASASRTTRVRQVPTACHGRGYIRCRAAGGSKWRQRVDGLRAKYSPFGSRHPPLHNSPRPPCFVSVFGARGRDAVYRHIMRPRPGPRSAIARNPSHVSPASPRFDAGMRSMNNRLLRVETERELSEEAGTGVGTSHRHLFRWRRATGLEDTARGVFGYRAQIKCKSQDLI
jgi:hypothetical protein